MLFTQVFIQGWGGMTFWNQMYRKKYLLFCNFALESAVYSVT